MSTSITTMLLTCLVFCTDLSLVLCAVEDVDGGDDDDDDDEFVDC